MNIAIKARAVGRCLPLFLLFLFCAPSWATEQVSTRMGMLEFDSGYPTKETTKKLYDELDFQRAVQSYLWAMPFVSYSAAVEATLQKGGNNHTVVIQPNSAEQQQLILTGNQDTVYLSGVLDLTEGPVVLELPPACWAR